MRFAFLASLLFAACSRTPRTAPSPTATPVTPAPPPTVTASPSPSPDGFVVDGRFLLVPAAQATQFLVGASDGTGFFRPTLADVQRVHAELDGFLGASRSARALSPDLHVRYRDYFSQWAGALQSGHRVLHGNYFCRDFGMDWKTQPIGVDDGGDCFFQVIYDLDASTFTSLQVNGNG